MWKATAPNGSTCYLGGSVHALRSSDYPLPVAYNRAFDASDRLAFETEENPGVSSIKKIRSAGKYPPGDSLKNHVDPRTFAYLRRFFTLLRVPEKEYTSLRPWMLVVTLQSSDSRGASSALGVEGFLGGRARATKKQIVGLETIAEHYDVFSGLTDRQAEALLLLTFIPDAPGAASQSELLAAWRRGDATALTRITQSSFADFPAFGDRIIGARNRRWIPKIESYMQSGKTYFVVAGAAHFGGPGGVVALLRARGYSVEQL
ncbi:MAG: TraB/GumN family protein [Chthoniobacterales bacterium]